MDGFAVEGGVGLEVEGGRAVGGGRLLQQLQALVQIVLQITVYVNMKKYFIILAVTCKGEFVRHNIS